MRDRKQYSKEYYIKNKEKIMDRYFKNKEKINKLRKKYRQKNRERICREEREYYKKNINAYKKYRQKNRERINKTVREKYLSRKKSWEKYIPKETNCQVCGKKIYFNQIIKENVICFDHKNENIPIKVEPAKWLGLHPRTPENQKIWESCDFGMLCNSCNGFFPTKNREQFIKNVVKYVFGNNATIIN